MYSPDNSAKLVRAFDPMHHEDSNQMVFFEQQ